MNLHFDVPVLQGQKEGRDVNTQEMNVWREVRVAISASVKPERQRTNTPSTAARMRTEGGRERFRKRLVRIIFVLNGKLSFQEY